MHTGAKIGEATGRFCNLATAPLSALQKREMKRYNSEPMNSAAWPWVVQHWKLWGISSIVVAALGAVKRIYDIRKARADALAAETVRKREQIALGRSSAIPGKNTRLLMPESSKP